jgi:hypothetical protein
MFKDAFEKLDLAEVATLVDRLNPLFEGVVFDAVQTTIMGQDISFYPGHRLLDIADYSMMPPLQRFVVDGGNKAFVLNFTNEPIYRLNREVPVRLSKDNVADYVRFFFTYVRGRHGRFLISESVDDIQWREDPPPAARKAISNMLKSLTVKSGEKNGPYVMEACMVFKDSLFRSMITVSPDGLVNLGDEELLIEDMPVLDDTFGQ